jgi:hypothetical protein
MWGLDLRAWKKYQCQRPSGAKWDEYCSKRWDEYCSKVTMPWL